MKKIAFLLLMLSAACQKTDEQVSPNTPTNNSGNTNGNQVTNSQQPELLRLVNEYRSKGCNCGTTAMPPVAALVWNTKLETAATKHSQEMEKTNVFSHKGQNGSNAGQRISAEGYTWRTWGENIANGSLDEKSVMEGWISSEGHCKNIMNANFKEMGVGKSGKFWTQVLAAPL